MQKKKMWSNVDQLTEGFPPVDFLRDEEEAVAFDDDLRSIIQDR